MNKYIFAHGFGTNAEEMTWMQLAAEHLSSLGHLVIIPTFPSSNLPVFAEWRSTFLDAIEGKGLTAELIVIAHSLGAAFVMMLANESKFKKLIAIAPGYVGHISKKEYFKRSSRDEETKNLMYQFFVDGGRINPAKVKENIKELILIYSKDDNKIAEYTKEFFVNEVQHDQYREFDGYGHFMTKGENPVNEFPELMSMI